MDTKERILDTSLELFKEKGLKFTMDDVAKKLAISKKTIYVYISTKEELFCAMCDHCFNRIKEAEQSILSDDSLSTAEKLTRVLGVMPESYVNLDFAQLWELKDKYPNIYRRVEERLETGWEPTLALLSKGVEEGTFRPVSAVIVKTMLEATLEQFFKRDILMANHISYNDALKEVVDVIMNGIITKED